MQTIKITIRVSEGDVREAIIALLSDVGYDAFEEEEELLFAFISEDRFNEGELSNIISLFALDYDLEVVAQQNWNQMWEDSIQPLVVDDFCTIVTDFHDVDVKTAHKIVITPKMSFGTGHHATTQLMMTAMRELDFKGKSVIDFGTGTGVLAILAAQMGANAVLAIDNDEWSVENAAENIERNNCAHIDVRKASIEELPNPNCDILLANINRHILLHHMELLGAVVCSGGVLLMSGLLKADEEVVKEAAVAAGFAITKVNDLSGWISILCVKL